MTNKRKNKTGMVLYLLAVLLILFTGCEGAGGNSGSDDTTAQSITAVESAGQSSTASESSEASLCSPVTEEGDPIPAVRLMAGAGRADITPELGTGLSGYAVYTRFADIVHDRLNAIIIVFEYDGARSALLSMDLSGMSEAGCKEIKELIQESAGIPAGNIIVSCTHTHSGPSASVNSDYYAEVLLPAVAEAAEAANESLAAVKVGIGTIQSEVGINRRYIHSKGTALLLQNPYGPYDPEMTLIRLISDDGTPVANIIHYGAHATAAGIGGDVTRDWPGMMKDSFEEEHGGITLFIPGAIGDVAPRIADGMARGTVVSDMYSVGYRASADADRAYDQIDKYDSGLQMEAFQDFLYIPFADAEEDGPKNNDNGRSFDQMILRIGPVAIVPIFGEAFSETVMEIRGKSPYPYTLCVSIANGSVGYIPTYGSRVYGGYEVNTSGWLSGYTEKADEAISSENIRILTAMHEAGE